MPEHITTTEWRKQNESTRYPFSSESSLQNDNGRKFEQNTFVDAILYPIGNSQSLHVTSVVINFQSVQISIGTVTRPDLATGSFEISALPEQIPLYDEFGRPAGLLVSEAQRLGVFQSWGVGTHTFTPAQTEFCASCVIPTPDVGVRGVRLETGELFVGDVWLVGDNGVVLTLDNLAIPITGEVQARHVSRVKVNVVGDPLFRRRLCAPGNLFSTPNFVKRLRVLSATSEFIAVPDENGNINLTVANDLAVDTVLRVITTEEGLMIGTVGSRVT